jgi:TPR repeat protein
VRSVGWRGLAIVAGAAVCGACEAGPVEDHAAGLQAYRRGDVSNAMTPLRRAADAGHAPSQTLLAFILEAAGVTTEAAALYRRAAEQGDVEAEVALASMLVAGRGGPGDPREAFRLFSRAADRGDPRAIRAVAEIHLRGDRQALGADASDADALAALRRAGVQGHVASVERLVQVYRQGLLGVIPDTAESARWQAQLARLRSAEPRK